VDVIVLSDSDEDHKPFGLRTKKRKIDSDSEDEYEPPPVKGQKKIKMDTKSGTSKKDEKLQADSKERKPMAASKRTLMKNKAFKTESKNKVCICFSVAGLDVWIQVFWDTMMWFGIYLPMFWNSFLVPHSGWCLCYP
jgi:hypothetical protein